MVGARNNENNLRKSDGRKRNKSQENVSKVKVGLLECKKTFEITMVSARRTKKTLGKATVASAVSKVQPRELS